MDRLCAAVRLTVIITGLAIYSLPTPTRADGLNTSAEYIIGFFRYVQWPDEERLPAWNVCYVGELPQEQGRIYAERTARNKPISARSISADAPINDCQVLDLTTADIKTAKRILARSRLLPILAVGSRSDFCSIGGQICLNLNSVGVKGLPKFGVNLSTIRESKLEISARLLTIGQIRAGAEDTR